MNGDAGILGTLGNVLGIFEEDDGQCPLYGIDRLGGLRPQFPRPSLNARRFPWGLGECSFLVSGEPCLVCVGGGCAEEGCIHIPLMLPADGVYGPTAGSTCLMKSSSVGR